MWAAMWMLTSCGAPAAECAPATSSTFDEAYDAFYVCLEDEVPCGPDGYAAGFGGRYVRTYIEEVRPQMSPDGAAWLGRVGVCLQEELAASLDDDPSCDELWTAGFATHAPCYLSTGYCELAPADQIAVLATITEADREIPEVQDAVRNVLDGCAR